MPNWKKIIVSGSNAILSSLKVPSIVSAGSVTTGTNVLTVGSDGKLHMTGSYGGGAGGVTSVSGTGTKNGLTLTGTVTTSGNLTLGGTLAISNSDWSGTDLSVANGGTGASTLGTNEILIGQGTSAVTTDSGFTYTSNTLGTEGLNISAPTNLSAEATSLMIDEDGAVGIRELGSNAFNSTTIPTNAVLTSGNQSISGVKTFTNDIIARNGGVDGGMKIGGWPQSPNGYGFIGTANMTGLEYCMISDGTNTFLGAGTGGALKLRGPANDSSPEIIINGVIVEVNTGDLKVTDGSIAVGNITNSTTDGRIDASNDVVAFSSSDKKLKENIKPIKNALDKVSQISGVEFDWKELTEDEKLSIHGNEGHDVGVIAQEIEKVLPEVVQTRDNGYKAVKYEKIVPLLIESIKELKAEIEELKKSK
jgi:hypothetical protein